jgi:hypothetical protein
MLSQAQRSLYILLLLLLAPLISVAQSQLSGTLLDPKFSPVPDAHLQLSTSTTRIAETTTDPQGHFLFTNLAPASYHLSANSPSFLPVSTDFALYPNEQKSLTLQFTQLAAVLQSITVIASSPSSLSPDPSQTVIVHDQVLDANPGRPGAPISIPGLPIETASGGIKAPQYFAPGVAGDHGEPIAQFFQVGNFLFPNNLPANAHGNGYSDPNFLIPATIEAVTVDGGAFNVREGNHAVDLASTYIPRQRLNSFLQLTGDYRDIDLVAGWSPKNPNTNAFLSAEASYGNGFLERLEHRQQYKLNGYRQFKFGRHELTLFGLAYYGFSYVPGLIPIQFPVPNDTIDNRQLDRTNNFLAAANDTWRLTNKSQFNFAAFFRDYALTLRSNFGDGLIQQSETRTVLGGEVSYLYTVNSHFALLAGIDLRRDAPRNLDLDRSTIPFPPLVAPASLPALSSSCSGSSLDQPAPVAQGFSPEAFSSPSQSSNSICSGGLTPPSWLSPATFSSSSLVATNAAPAPRHFFILPAMNLAPAPEARQNLAQPVRAGYTPAQTQAPAARHFFTFPTNYASFPEESPFTVPSSAFLPATANNLTLSFAEPFLSADGSLTKFLHYDVGFREEIIRMDNQDLLIPTNSFDKLTSLALPKATITFLPNAPGLAPAIAFSYGESFHTEDPRIGNAPGTTTIPSLVAPSRSYQLRFSKTIHQFETNLTLRRTSNAQELAKIDPDTGLPENFGPSLNRVIAISVQRNFSHGAFYISYGQADARDTQTGAPTPEAPRLIWDAVASENHLPFGLQARGEFEFVRAKPLGDGFTGVPVYETRGAILRPFFENKMSLAVNFLIAKGYTGQTTETIPTQPAPCPVECIVGVPLKSYVALTYSYFFSH